MENKGNEIADDGKVKFSAIGNQQSKENGGRDKDEENKEKEEEVEEEEEEEYEEEEEDTEEELNEMTQSHLKKIDASKMPPVKLFESLGYDYEALARNKRKMNFDNKGDGSSKKARQDDISEATFDKILESINYCCRRRRARKTRKRGRHKCLRKKVDPKIMKMLGDATVCYTYGDYEKGISILSEVVMLAPHVPESYHTLGLIHIALGNIEKANAFYMIAAHLMPKDSPMWKLLLYQHIEKGDVAEARICLLKAIRADPNDITLRHYSALHYVDLGKNQKAAESFEQIVRICPENVDALRAAAKLYFRCGQIERSIAILEGYMKSHPFEADTAVVELLAATLMQTNRYDEALLLIGRAHSFDFSIEDLPLLLKVKAGICFVHLKDIEKAEVLFGGLQQALCEHMEMISEVADAFMNVKHFKFALKYYLMLHSNIKVSNEGDLFLKIAHCYLSLQERTQAILFFYKALPMLTDSIDTRLTLASLILEDAREEEEAISLLTPPKNFVSTGSNSDKQKPWWIDWKIKLKLCHVYKSSGMLKDMVNSLLPLVRESFYAHYLPPKARKRFAIKKAKCFNIQKTDDLYGDELLESQLNKEKSLQMEKEILDSTGSADIDGSSAHSGDESLKENEKEPLVPNIFKDEAHHDLLMELCKGLQSMKRYGEALEIVNLFWRLACDALTVEKKRELQSIVAQLSCKTTNPKHGFGSVRSIVLQHPYSIAAWNFYYKVTSRLERNYAKHLKFLRHMRATYNDCLPSFLICGHQFTINSRHQDAAREYLEAYRQLPDNPLVNLCVGTSFINLALGFRLQNIHRSLAQGFAFLYNNLRLSKDNQEALYNIGRACHHVGLVTVAVVYYERVLLGREEEHPLPKLMNDLEVSEAKPVPSHLRREAAYNLHLIYKKSGAIDLARQVLKDNCSF